MKLYFSTTHWRGVFYPVVVLFLIVSGMLSACGKKTTPPENFGTLTLSSAQIAVKAYVNIAGLYELDANDLHAAGLENALSDPSLLHLYYKGFSQPLWEMGQGKERKFLFYAQASDRLDRRENVYWLILRPDGSIPALENNSKPQATVEVSPPELPTNTYLATVHVEENKLYLPQVDGPDHWYWLTLAAPQAHLFTVSLDSIATGPAKLKLAIWATTDSPAAMDHRVRVLVNGHLALDESWDGQGYRIFTAELPIDLLQEGTNEIQVEVPTVDGVAADIIQVDWLEIEYPRYPTAINDRLEFVAQNKTLKLSGFTRPVVLVDISDPLRPKLVSPSWDTARNFTGEMNHRYLAVGPNGIVRPLRLEPAMNKPDLHSPGIGADYVAIGPPDLLTPLRPLLDWRASQGLKVLAVPLEAVYDQFNHGIPDQAAIQAFMRYASTSWKPVPQYLLLVGDSSYDPNGYLGPAESYRLPPFLVNTIFGGETASDVNFVQVNDDPYPDLAVGLIPAQDASQVKTIVEKTIQYEQESKQKPSTAKVLAISDGQDPSFRADAEAFLDLFPAGKFQVQSFSPQTGDSKAHNQIKSDFQQEYTLIAYFGHGSINMWGKDRLFHSEDVNGLPPTGLLPVVLNFTCLTGYYLHPTVESLAEALLWQPGAGAVAVLAPSSLTLPTDQGFLSNEFARLLGEHPDYSLGQLHKMARRSIPSNSPGAMDVMQTFMLFGDPALKLAVPPP